MFPETKGKSWSNLRQAAPPIPPKMPPQLRNCSWRAPPWKMLYFSQRWIGNKSLSKIAIGQRSSILAEFQILIDITQTCGCSLKKGLTKCFCPLAFNCKNMFGKFCHVTKCTFFPPKCSMSALNPDQIPIGHQQNCSRLPNLTKPFTVWSPWPTNFRKLFAGWQAKVFLNFKVERSNYFWSLFLEPLIVILKKDSKSYQSLKKWFNRRLLFLAHRCVSHDGGHVIHGGINGSRCSLHGSLGGSLGGRLDGSLGGSHGGSNCRSLFFEVFSSLLSWITWCYRTASQHPPRHTSRGRR